MSPPLLFPTNNPPKFVFEGEDESIVAYVESFYLDSKYHGIYKWEENDMFIDIYFIDVYQVKLFHFNKKDYSAVIINITDIKKKEMSSKRIQLQFNGYMKLK